METADVPVRDEITVTDADALRDAAVDGEDWSMVALTILSDRKSKRLSRHVVHVCASLIYAETYSDLDIRKLRSLVAFCEAGHV